MIHARWLALVLATLAMTVPVSAGSPSHKLLDFEDLDGWAADNRDDALKAFLATCDLLKDPHWVEACKAAESKPRAATFFQQFLSPVLIEDGGPALFTGYYEPELEGSTVPSSRFRYPVYKAPPELTDLWKTRREIEESGTLDNRGLEIAWLADPVERFFLQIQGSGRIRLHDGRVIRIGYSAGNGHPYKSIGAELVRRRLFQPSQVSARVIRNWVRKNPTDGKELLYHNPKYVFFRQLDQLTEDQGPLGAMNRPITPLRSIAVDPSFVPLGAPVWIEKDGADPLRRLMIAQDTGSAIKGAQRADIFYGSGHSVGELAGRVRDQGRMIVLLPRQLAQSITQGDP